MAYYIRADEPPGQWYGRGAAKPGLNITVPASLSTALACLSSTEIAEGPAFGRPLR